jgi:ubiquinone biosynthesis accessory factor UbiJ
MLGLINAPFLLPVNHLLAQSSWARERLRGFAGKCAAISVFPLQLRLSVTAEGFVAAASAEQVADVFIALTPPLLVRVLAGDENTEREVTIEGDTAFAQELALLAKYLRWDYEEDLSKVVGDVLAHRVGETVRGLSAWQAEAAQNLAENFRDYWIHERPLLASRLAIERFNRDVDELRDSAERLAKRIELLAKQ